MIKSDIAAIILASGYSSRFQGALKPLATIGGSLIQHCQTVVDLDTGFRRYDYSYFLNVRPLMNFLITHYTSSRENGKNKAVAHGHGAGSQKIKKVL
ncbi:MAG: hypothetical protein JW832_16025 [Deltaproteobacteria bacterium]|nr:hypothetical protein [Deltaproteobacteria bacterium]